MEEIIKSLNDVVAKIDESIKAGAVPDVAKSYLERLCRSIRDTLKVIEIVSGERTIQTGISPSARSAMFTLRKAYYATLGRLVKEQGVDRELSSANWRTVAGELIEFINKEGISEAPTKIVLDYDIAEKDGVKYIKIKRAQILFFELEGMKEKIFE